MTSISHAAQPLRGNKSAVGHGTLLWGPASRRPPGRGRGGAGAAFTAAATESPTQHVTPNLFKGDSKLSQRLFQTCHSDSRDVKQAGSSLKALGNWSCVFYVPTITRDSQHLHKA